MINSKNPMRYDFIRIFNDHYHSFNKTLFYKHSYCGIDFENKIYSRYMDYKDNLIDLIREVICQ